MQRTAFNARLSSQTEATTTNIVGPTSLGVVASVCTHPWRPRGSQSGREKKRDESLQVRAEEPLGTDSHRTISKHSSEYRLLIGHKKCFVSLCLIGEQFLLSSFREFVHDGYCLATLARFVHQACAHKGNYRPYHGFRRHLDG